MTLGLISVCIGIVQFFRIASSLPTENIFFNIAVVFQRIFSSLNMIVILIAKSRMTLINKCFEQHASPSRNFRELLSIHNKIGDIIQLINKCLSMNIMMSITEFYFFCTFLTYQIYDCIIKGYSWEYRIFVLSGVIFLVPEIVYMASIFISSMLLKTEANRTFSFCNAENATTASSNIIKFFYYSSLQMKHRTIEISCGLFSFDFKFVFLMISSLLANFLILVQFDVKKGN